MSGLPEYATHSCSDGLPPRLFHSQLLLAGGSQFVDAGASPILLVDPFGANPAGLLHAVQGGVEGALPHAENLVGNALNGGHDGVAMQAGTAGGEIVEPQTQR